MLGHQKSQEGRFFPGTHSQTGVQDKHWCAVPSHGYSGSIIKSYNNCKLRGKHDLSINSIYLHNRRQNYSAAGEDERLLAPSELGATVMPQRQNRLVAWPKSD